jgi:hypothetical protein
MAGKQYKIFLTGDNGTLIELIGKIDLIPEFSHTSSSKITDVPVESGGSISDHVIHQPETLSISAIVSNIYHDPIYEPMFDSVDGILTAEQRMSQFDSGVAVQAGRPEAVYNELLTFKKNKQMFTIQSMLGVYQNMLIQDISSTENSSTGTALFVRIGMKEMVFAESSFSTETVVIDSKKIAVLPIKEQPKKVKPAWTNEEERIAYINSCPTFKVNAVEPKAVFRDANGPLAWKPKSPVGNSLFDENGFIAMMEGR